MTSLTNAARFFFNIRSDSIRDDIAEHKTMVEGAIETVGFNLTPIKNTFDITVSSSAWEVTGGAVSLSSDSNTAITTQVNATAGSTGRSRLKNTITMSDGQVIVRFIVIDVVRLERTKDYPSF